MKYSLLFVYIFLICFFSANIAAGIFTNWTVIAIISYPILILLYYLIFRQVENKIELDIVKYSTGPSLLGPIVAMFWFGPLMIVSLIITIIILLFLSADANYRIKTLNENNKKTNPEDH
jgi:hypothetical protein